MPQVFGPYSKATASNGLLFVAGQVGVDSSSSQASPVFSEQMHTAVANLVQVLEDSGLTLVAVKNVRVYLTDMNNFETMNKIFAEYFTGIAPSRECVAVKELPPVANTPLLIELGAVAELRN